MSDEKPNKPGNGRADNDQQGERYGISLEFRPGIEPAWTPKSTYTEDDGDGVQS